MHIVLRPLEEQVIFITGATNGIGLATVHRAVEQGAKVFMVAGNENELKNIHEEMTGKGYETDYAVCDVTDFNELKKAAEKCISLFERIDTFVNNAGISFSTELPGPNFDKERRLFDINFWGTVNGCKVAVPLMRHHKGVIINVGSILPQIAPTLQGIYCASKDAVKAYTDVLRKELLAEKIPLQVTLVTSGPIDNTSLESARPQIDEPAGTPPVPFADVVAKTILSCAIKPSKEIGVGMSAYIHSFMARFMTEENLPKEHALDNSMVTEVAEKKGLFETGAMAAGLALLFFRRLRSKA